MATASAALQQRIDAQQDLDALTYALKATEARRLGFPEAAGAQWRAGAEVAQRTTGFTGDEWSLKRAKAAAAERLKAAKAELKSFGGIRQLRILIEDDGRALAA